MYCFKVPRGIHGDTKQGEFLEGKVSISIPRSERMWGWFSWRQSKASLQSICSADHQ
jgi:hypothetical protein